MPNSCLLVPAAKILEAYPILEETHAIDVILPKKESAVLAKWFASLESRHSRAMSPVALCCMCHHVQNTIAKNSPQHSRGNQHHL